MTKLSRLYAVLTVYFVITNVIPSSALKGGYEDLHIYDYKAEISVGVEEPRKYVSKYSLQGLIKVQRDVIQLSVFQYNYLISLKEVKHDSYYGEDTIRINKYEPIDEQLLGNAFTAIYKTNGQLMSTVFNKNEAQWSKKIKESIARLLQFNWSDSQKYLNKEGQMDLAPVEEISVHGKCFVNYNTTLIKNKKINLVKIIHPTTCNNFVRDFSGYGINNKASVNEIKTRLDHKKTKVKTVYELENIKNQPIVKKIFNFERYRVDYDSNSSEFNHNPHFVKVRQTLFLKKTEPGYEFLHNSEKTVTSNNQNVKINQEQIIGKVKEFLLEINQLVNEHKLVEINHGAEHRQTFNRIQHYLKYLDVHSFEKLYNEIKISKTANSRQVLTQIIPYIGTKSSLSFIKTMIMDKKVSDADAFRLISTIENIQNSDKILPELKIFLKKNSGLAPKVQQAAVHSFSCLVSKICKNSPDSFDVSMEKYIPSIYTLMKDAKTMDAKLEYLTALGNTQCHGAVTYIKEVLPRKNNDSKDQVRLRMVAIWMLLRLIDADDTDVLDELTKILYDKKETKELRLAAYKVLVRKRDFDTDNLIEIGRKISANEYLQNYHLTTMRNFNKIGLLTDEALKKIDSKTAKLSSLLLTNMVINLDGSLNLRLPESFFKLKSKYVRLVVLGHFHLRSPIFSVPTSVEIETFDVIDGQIVVDQALYWHSNFNSFMNDDEKNDDEVVFVDILDLRNDRYTFNSIELSQKIIEDLNIEEFINGLIDSLMKPWFLYNDLQSFSIPTGFGIDAVYLNRKPALINITHSHDLSMTLDYATLQMKFSYDNWIHGYSDISFNNPISQLKYSARKTYISETTLAASMTAKYNFNKQSFELILPIVSEDPQLNLKQGSSVYISSSVTITDRDDEFSCTNCGYQYTTESGSRKHTKRLETPLFKPLGLSNNQLLYDCDIPDSPRSADLTDPDLATFKALGTCGRIVVMESDASVSQIELVVGVDELKLIKSTSSPWYFVPGLEFNVDSYVRIRKSLNNDVTTLGKVNMTLSSSQGHFLTEGRFRLTIRLDDNKNFNFCLDGKASFPNVTDTQFPSKVTDFNVFYDMRISYGEFKDEFCMGAKDSFEIRFTGEVSQEYLDELEQHSRNRTCAKQMRNSSFVYPSGSYLMTKNCISELISKTSVRRYRIDFKSDEITAGSLIVIYGAIEQVKIKLKEDTFKKLQLDVDVKLLSEIHEIVLNKTISFQIDIKDHYSKVALSLPNFYFPSDFLQSFIKNRYKVINVYPNLVLFNNNERKDLVASLKDWTFLVGDDGDPSYTIYVKLLDGGKLTLKLLHNRHELRLEPSVKKESSNSNFEPRVFYNEYIDDFSERTFLKSDEEIIFSLLKSDGYLVVHPTEIPIIIYYSDHSVTVLHENFLG